MSNHSTVVGSLDGRGQPAAPVASGRSYLLVFDADTTRMIPLPEDGECVIGRGETCDVRVEDPRVSRAHARLMLKGGQARLHDLGSQNGTRLNEARVGEPVALASGDVLVVGNVTLVFHSSHRVKQHNAWVDPLSFQQRAEVELERSRRFLRPLVALHVTLDGAPPLATLKPAVETVLRQSDLATFSSPQLLSVLLTETDADEGRALADGLLAALMEAGAGQVKAGLATCPEDAAHPETLFLAARTAAQVAPPGEVAHAAAGSRVLSVGSSRVVVADPTMLRLYELIQRLAPSPLPVLVRGETGAGKELVASALHHFSPRASQRLLAVNCAAFQETLLESELFGHEKGAFTGATTSKVGVFEAANGGTLFLDEVGEMTPALQAKLLRALETQRITRVGDTQERKVDLRVVAATHRDLAQEVKAGRFREDLFFRLSGATLWIPPLRDRPQELPLLARRFLEEACLRAGHKAPVLTPGAWMRLTTHRWPGNIRELKNVMEFLAATALDGTIEAWHVSSRLDEPSHAPAETRAAASLSPSTPPPLAEFRSLAEEVRELEERRMLEALNACEWNQTRAAAAIQMPLRTFVTRFKQLELGRRRPDSPGT